MPPTLVYATILAHREYLEKFRKKSIKVYRMYQKKVEKSSTNSLSNELITKVTL